MKFKKHQYRILIRENHLDTFGHVNNATYLQILEEARWELLNQGGFGLAKIKESGLGPVVLGVDIKFLRELKLRQNIVVESEIISYEKKIAVLRQDIIGEDGTKHSEATLTFSFFNTHTRKLQLPTPEWLNAIGAVSG